tara:strand:+ start:683 stop:1027 length:345 start_codon:yes stop_codon:yes gene_type:complete
MPKGLNITITDADVEPISVLTFKKIRIGANHNPSNNTTTISSIYDETTEQEINDNFATWKQEYLDYQPTVVALSNRKKEYPAIEDQLDYIYHNGVTKWKTDMITPIKEKYPKPD